MKVINRPKDRRILTGLTVSSTMIGEWEKLTHQPRGLIVIHWKQSQNVQTMALKCVIKKA
jgi:hypothetical protein